MMASVSALPGAIVLVSYRPDEQLFRHQLESIQNQTRTDFRCFISEDGDVERTRLLVSEIVGGDARFEVVGFADNLGFYLNVERALGAVPAEVGWVALSDQDDRWYPDKLERLVPLLDDTVLAMNQARVVTWPGRHVLVERTARDVTGAAALAIENRVTGSFAAFRRELLDVALPFPRLRTFTAYHDHWIGLCAAATGGYAVLDIALQDYVQHGANVAGEPLGRPPRSVLRAVRNRPRESFVDARRLAAQYEGSASIQACLRVHGVGSFGWRRTMVEAAVARVPAPPSDLVELSALLATESGLTGLLTLVRSMKRCDAVSRGTLEAFLAGLPHEALTRLSDRRARRA